MGGDHGLLRDICFQVLVFCYDIFPFINFTFWVFTNELFWKFLLRYNLQNPGWGWAKLWLSVWHELLGSEWAVFLPVLFSLGVVLLKFAAALGGGILKPRWQESYPARSPHHKVALSRRWHRCQNTFWTILLTNPPATTEWEWPGEERACGLHQDLLSKPLTAPFLNHDADAGQVFEY